MPKIPRSRRQIIIPIVVGGIFALLNVTLAWKSLENKVYDLFLHLKPAVAEAPSIVLLNIDEESIVRTASWPWPRGLVARGLETLAEFNAGYAVFDIEYLEKSPMSVDRDYLTGGLKSEFDGFFDEAGSNIGYLFNALATRAIPLKDAGSYGNELVGLLQEGKKDLYAKTERVAVENDSYLGKAMRLFGSAFVTLNMQDGKIAGTSDELRAIAGTRFSYPKVTEKETYRWTKPDFLVPIKEISNLAAGAGFTNVEIDQDGIRRRVMLVHEVEGKYYLQLAFAPLIDALGKPEIVLSNHRVVLKDVQAGGKKRDVSIPLDERGHMLLRWPKKRYEDSFTHVSFYRLLEYRNNEEALVANLRTLRAMEAWALVSEANPVEEPLAAWSASEEARLKALESGAAEDRTAWIASKAAFKESVALLLSNRWDERIPELIDAAKSAANPVDAPLYEDLKSRFVSVHRNCAEALGIIDSSAKELRRQLEGSTCIIGWTGTATTDMGANPFVEQYVNVGTHATLYNTILQRDFLSEAPVWTGSLLTLLLSFAVVALIARLKTLQQIIVGIGATVVVFFGCYALFHFTGLHVPTLAPTVAVFFAFLSYALVSFFVSEREKSFLRKAFGTYLSGDVINEIIADPSMLKLGGQKKWITAMFTDVKGFSTVSEKLDPEQLVKLLNLYLSGMSNIILENRGTIDKYEGDAIISFFGAPVTYQEHARAACYSAVRMKKREAELNDQFLKDGLSPTPLLTRIGLNTGDMVVGNMGTERKMDYTIMGNAVNLAARLEGVNKQYGSWILASDATKKEAGDEFVTRRFDRVRVVGINTPVQLWEIVDLRAETTEETLDFLDRFERAHAAFDVQQWEKAEKLFDALAKERPADGPSATYLRRSQEFQKKPPAAGWDGVFSLTEK